MTWTRISAEWGGLVVPEGADVDVIAPERAASVHLQPDELAELEDDIAAADRGEIFLEEELFLRRRRLNRS